MKKELKHGFQSLKSEIKSEVDMNHIMVKNCEEKMEVFGRKVQQIRDYLNKVDMT